MGSRYTQLMRNMRIRFGQAPREFDRDQFSYLNIKPPNWCRPGQDLLHMIYRDHETLLSQGTIVWAVLVMANNQLFAAGKEDHPGLIVYCPQPHWHDDLIRLDEVAKKIGELKTSAVTAKEKEIGKWLVDEQQRFLDLPAPETIVGKAPVRIGCNMFIRKHLPTGVLTTNQFPILVHPSTKATLILPSRFWDREMLDLWRRD
jgi:hypothetical protein